MSKSDFSIIIFSNNTIVPTNRNKSPLSLENQGSQINLKWVWVYGIWIMDG